MAAKKNHRSNTGTSKIGLIVAGSLVFFSSLSNIFFLYGWDTNPNLYTEDNVSDETNYLTMGSLDVGMTDVDANGTITSEAVTTRVESEVVRSYHVSDTHNLKQHDTPPISSTAIIDGTAINNATMNASTITVIQRYNQLIGPFNHEYKDKRNATYKSWFESGSDRLRQNADKNGPILDLFIAGFAKCGTTSVEANLGNLAPMPVADICTPISKTVYYAYKSMPKLYGEHKMFRGSKCPQYITSNWIEALSKLVPHTTIIIGIRHPVLWFQSFWNMQASHGLTKFAKRNPYMIIEPCVPRRACNIMCPHRWHFCLHQGRFHVALATLGKTALSEEERKLLAPNDMDGGINLISKKIRNPVFLYEQTELRQDYVWDEMAKYFNVTTIPHDKYVSSHGGASNRSIDFCEERMDGFRAMMMPYAYELSVWMQDYFIPVAKDESSSVTVPNPDKLIALVEEYKKDPCGRLYRLTNGTYVLYTNKTTMVEVKRRFMFVI